jgi:predicted GNAT family acetyltransferase
MATLPIEGRWSIKALTDEDAPGALSFLRRDSVMNVYLISRLLEERYTSSTQTIEVRHNHQIVVIASLATNVVLSADKNAREDVVDGAIGVVADRIITRLMPVRAIISPAPLVESLWRRLQTRLDPPTVVRMNQPVYAIQGRTDYPDLKQARYSTSRDLDALVPACAAMHKEEVGIDPLERDAVGYRERVRELIDKKRSVILVQDQIIVAKCEYSAVTPDAVQLMGVWTDPRYRRRGLARELLREVCGHLTRSHKSVTLFVNDFNRPAISLYEALGFKQIGMNRALIW